MKYTCIIYFRYFYFTLMYIRLKRYVQTCQTWKKINLINIVYQIIYNSIFEIFQVLFQQIINK